MGSRKLHVLHVTASTSLAGAERVLLNYLDCCDRDVTDVGILMFVNVARQQNPFTDELEKRNIPLTRILLGEKSYPALLRETAEVVRASGVDLVHTHGYLPDVTTYRAARLSGVPIVSTVHGWTPVSWKLRMYEALDRWYLRRFDRVICVSRPLYDGLLHSGVKRQRLALLPNAVSFPPAAAASAPGKIRDELGLMEDERIVLSVGRLSPEKGLDILLESFRDISTHFSGRLRLVVVGDGPVRAELVRHAERLGIGSRTIFMGFRSDIADFYAAADLFVLPSFTEGTPMSLLEAMSVGLPVVCSRVGGVPDIVTDRHDGLLVEPGNPQILTRAMRELLSGEKLAADISARARETVASRYGRHGWAASIEDIYREVCAEVRNEG